MKDIIQDTLTQALSKLGFADQLTAPIKIDRTRDAKHGDFASNVAMLLAKPLGKSPREIAQNIIDAMVLPAQMTQVEIAGPGFINFYLKNDAQNAVIQTILNKKDNYGKSQLGQGKKVHVEFVSANPTGPLHVGHGRGAAYGSALANVLQFAGFDVYREYYVNDAGRQMDILAVSVWLRYLELFGESFTFPSNGYKGAYVKDIAAELKAQYADQFTQKSAAVFDNICADEPQGGDKEKHIDALIARAKDLLGPDFDIVHQYGLDQVLDGIKTDLADFNVHYNNWFSEKSLDVNSALARLQHNGYLYQDQGATWFKSTEFGDDKDRVVKRDNGVTTYFASDAAYLLDKISRGFKDIICLFGADHHGYIARLQALRSAYDCEEVTLTIPLVQFAILYRGGERMQMSTRSGEFVTLKHLYDEVGVDAARYFYLSRKPEQHLDFDLDLAKSQSNDNPIYYIQYAYARICSVFRQLKAKGFAYDHVLGLEHLAAIQDEHSEALLKLLATFPELAQAAAQKQEPHLIAHYCRDLAAGLHRYYNAHQILVDDEAVRQARLVLLEATQQVLHNALALLGVSAPEEM